MSQIEIYERVKKIRKALKLNQTEFGEKIGLKQRTIADIESGRNVLTDRNFECICRVFNVNPDWLRHEIGEMFRPQKKAQYLDALIDEYGLSKEHKIIIESILELPPEMWLNVINWIRNCSDKIRLQSLDSAKEIRRRELELQIMQAQKELAKIDSVLLFKSDDQLTREEAHALLDEELDAAQKRKAKSSVSIYTNGRAK